MVTAHSIKYLYWGRDATKKCYFPSVFGQQLQWMEGQFFKVVFIYVRVLEEKMFPIHSVQHISVRNRMIFYSLITGNWDQVVLRKIYPDVKR